MSASPSFLHRPWSEPLAAARAVADQPFALCLLSDGSPGARWSYVMARPSEVAEAPAGAGDFHLLVQFVRSTPRPASDDGMPPFRGGVAGLASYDFGAREATGREPGGGDWPDLILARYDATLAFDHHQKRVVAIGGGEDPDGAAAMALGWLETTTAPAPLPNPLAASFEEAAPPQAYEAAVADVVARIAAGELFQANIARAWTGRLAPRSRPFDAFAALAAASPAPYAAFWSLPGRALVSNSPETFLTVGASSRRIEARPIKGTRPRRADAAADALEIEALLASAKDRAENLMIVDLMRNDLSRVCAPGSVEVPRLFEVESFANVHHLVSTVTGALADGVDTADVLAATFPPGSITGAPKHQAMKVIAAHEGPRGPWCGSLFLAGDDGSLSASVLIRTLAFEEKGDGWRFRTLAGAGVVADSDPASERVETEAKIAAIRRALTGRDQEV